MKHASRFKRSKYEPGMIYAVPLGDETYCFVQALHVVGDLVNVIDIAVFFTRVEVLPQFAPRLEKSDLIAIGATWRQDLNRGDWAAMGVMPFLMDPDETPNQRLVKKGSSVGVKHSDAGLWVDLLRAWYGLDPWNVMFDPEYFDKVLAPGIRRPVTARVLSAAQREEHRAKGTY